MGRPEKDVDPNLSALHQFAYDLKQLRRQAPGSPSYRQLAAKAGYSPAALSSAASADRLPTLEVTLAYVGACGGDMDAWRERWQKLAADLRATAPGLLPAEQPAAPEPDGGRKAPATPPPTIPVVRPLAASDPRTIGPYRILGLLGAGAMGRVYLGVAHETSDQLAAVKVMRPELADSAAFRHRFRHELDAIRRVEGPATVPVLAGDAEAAHPWLATGYLAGPTLEEAVETHGPLPEATLRALAASIATALRDIHAADVVHRDLKPSNVLLTADGVRVIDFGVARAADTSKLTITGAHLGTPSYMAPEQAEGGSEPSPAADLFSLGAVLAYAATARPPFGEGSTSAVLYRVVHHDPDLDGLTSLDNNLTDLIKACLNKTADQRPSLDDVAARALADIEPTPWPPQQITEEIARREQAARTAVSQVPPAAEPDPKASRDGSTVPDKRRRVTRGSILLPVFLAIATVLALMIYGGAFGQPTTTSGAPKPSSSGIPISGQDAGSTAGLSSIPPFPSSSASAAAAGGTAAGRGTGGMAGAAVGGPAAPAGSNGAQGGTISGGTTSAGSSSSDAAGGTSGGSTGGTSGGSSGGSSGGTQGGPADPTPTYNCGSGANGWGCQGKDPFSSGCANMNAYRVAEQADAMRGGQVIGHVYMYYSKTCGTNWAVTAFISGYKGRVKITNGGYTNCYPGDCTSMGSWTNCTITPGMTCTWTNMAYGANTSVTGSGRIQANDNSWGQNLSVTPPVY